MIFSIMVSLYVVADLPIIANAAELFSVRSSL